MRQGHTRTAVIRWLSMRWRDTRGGVRLCAAMCLPHSAVLPAHPDAGYVPGARPVYPQRFGNNHPQYPQSPLKCRFDRGRGVKSIDTGSLGAANPVQQNRLAGHLSLRHPSRYCVHQARAALNPC